MTEEEPVRKSMHPCAVAGRITESSKISFFFGRHEKNLCISLAHFYTTAHTNSSINCCVDRRSCYIAFRLNATYAGFGLDVIYAGLRLLNGGQKNIFRLWDSRLKPGEIRQPRCSNFQWLKKTNKTSRTHVFPYTPRVRVFFSRLKHRTIHLQREVILQPKNKLINQMLFKNDKKINELLRIIKLICMTRKPYPVHNVHAYQCPYKFQRTGR